MPSPRPIAPAAELTAAPGYMRPRTVIAPLIRRGLRRLVSLARRRHGRCGCPACDPLERAARTAQGMPLRHPERVTAMLPAGQDRQLAALAAELWPRREYAAIITEAPGPDEQP